MSVQFWPRAPNVIQISNNYSYILENVGVIVYDSKVKSDKQLERCFKGVANHRRVAILRLVGKNKNINLERISEILGCNIKTISEHSRRLVLAGLLNKKYHGRTVEHALSPYGQKFVKFTKEF